MGRPFSNLDYSFKTMSLFFYTLAYFQDWQLARAMDDPNYVHKTSMHH